MNYPTLSIFILLVLLIPACELGDGKDQKEEDNQPNILFIMSDDHTAQAWGIYGGILQDYVKNENIKRLAQEGTVLENAFCTNSICVPSRASIMTGQYSHRNEIYTLSEGLDPDSNNVAKDSTGSRLSNCLNREVAPQKTTFRV